MKKKTAILIFSGVAVLLVALTVTLVLILHQDYIKKTDFDHVSSVSYNDVRIVGSEGLLYLCRGDEIISDGYISLRSVNDGYAEDTPHWLEADDIVLFDYYIARRAGLSQYLLVTASGEEYTITGDNYSLAAIRLPYLIFVNNTTGERAALSLLQLHSDLSQKNENDLSLTPFLEITPVRAHAEDALYSLLETKNSSAEAPYAVFTDEGKRIFSAKSYERKRFSDGTDHAAIYYEDTDTHTVFSPNGETLCVGAASIVSVNDEWGYAPLALNASGVPSGVAVFSYQKNYLITDPTLDFSHLQVFDGSLAIPKKDASGIALYRAIGGTFNDYASLSSADNGLLRATVAGSSEIHYMSEDGHPLLRSPHADMMLDTTLSSPECLVLTSAQYDAEQGGTRHLHMAKKDTAAITATIENGVTVTPLYANNGAVAIEGVFLLQAEQNGLPVYRLLAPFSSRLFSDAYDTIEVFSTGGIVWARGTSFSQKSYTILDPIGGQIASTIPADGEDLSKLLFEYVTCQSLLVDPHDADSAVPVLLFRLSCIEEDAPISSIRYFALYRSLPASSKSFDQGMLRILEVGKNLVRAEPVSFFAEDNAIVCRNTDFSHVYRMSESNVLAEVTTLPYRVSRVISDESNPTVKYFEVTTDDGKYGLYDVAATPILAPYYDSILAVSNGQLIVSLRGACGVLSYEDGKLRQLLDYRYTDIHALPDYGYLAVDGNELTYLFEGKRKLSNKSIPSSRMLTSYSIAENGSLQIRYSLLLSMNGRLWLHESDVYHEPFAIDVEQPSEVYEEIQNTRAIAVHYYQGKNVVATDMLYPTPAHQAAFALATPPVGNGWYASTTADPTTDIPVTVEDIITSGKHTVKLYAVE